MIKAKYINKEKYNSKSLNYDELLQQGIELIQQFSGNQWSDYNYHDPGITFLEQICFAITDLGYKTNFPIEDILLAHTDDFDLENSNLLIPPNKIFSSSPLTPIDYRKIIIDQDDTVKNVWVNPIKDNFFGINGIFDVLVQLKDGLSDSQIENSKSNIENILMENRSIGTDFNSITILKKDIISLSGKIIINSFVLGESVLAEIYSKVESKLNKELKFYDYEELLKQNNYENIFSGPLQKKKFIKENELNHKTNEIYQYEITEIIQSIEGVVSVEDIVVYKNGVKMFNDIIPFNKDCYPSLDKDYYGFTTDKLVFERNETSYEIDAVILNQLYDSISLNEKKTYSKKFKQKKHISEGRYSKNNIEYYYSIQNELPSLYGLKENEIPSSSNKKRKSQVNQLKGYLFLIEQIMSNYLSQLVNIRNFFSVEMNNNTLKTFYNQLPTDIADLNKIIGENNDSFFEDLNFSSESKKMFISRKNKVVDHLLARFGEIYDTSLITKLYNSINDNLSDYEIELKSLYSKLSYSKAIVKLGRNRIKGFNYKLKHDEKNNFSGLKQRLCLILNIQNNNIKSALDPLLEGSEINKIKSEWKTKLIEIENGPSISVIAPEDLNNNTNEVNFYCPNYDSLKSLFLYACKRKSYQIIKSKSKYNIVYNSPNQKTPANIFQSKSLKECRKALDKAMKKFNQFNSDCESFFVIENILLRPVVEIVYQLEIYKENNKVLLKSYYNSEYNILRDIRDDLSIIIQNKDNLSIEKDESSNKYRIIVYDLVNLPILKSENEFNSKAAAEKEKKQIISYFKTKIESKIEIDSFTEILIKNNILNKFPSEFKYSNHLNFIFPDWPIRFQNNDFKALIDVSIKEFIPAHMTYDIYYLDFQNLSIFEAIYFKWLNYRYDGNYEKLELESLQLIQLMMKCKNYVS